MVKGSANLREAIADRLHEIATRVSVDPELLAYAEARLDVSANVPPWWTGNGNVLVCGADVVVDLVMHPSSRPPRNAVVLIGAKSLPPKLMLWGESAFVHIGRHTKYPRGAIVCGEHSSVVLSGPLSVNGAANVDARNGGIVYVGRKGLWASDVRIATDDMHRIFDLRTGERINQYGSVVRIDDHVWLGEQVFVSPGASIGRDSVIGRRSLVTGDIPCNSLAVGTPARVIREQISWSAKDLPF